jgi:hypothetical protein
LPEPVAPARPVAVAGGGTGQRWVEEGPVELADASRVAVELAPSEPSRGDAEIIWDDVPAETAPRSGAGHVPGRPGGGNGGIARTPVARSPQQDAREAPAPGTTGPARKKGPRKAESARRQEGRSEGGGIAVGSPDAARTSRPAAARSRVPEAVEPAPARPAEGRRRNLHRWLVVLIPLLVVATVAWRVRQQHRQEYPLLAEKGRTEGIPALEEGDFVKANQLLAVAKSAVDALGGNVEDADQIRNAADEARIFVELIPETPEELLAQAGRDDPLTWESRFNTLYKGRSIIIDSWVTFAPSSGGAEPVEILYKVLPPGEASDFRDGKNARPDQICSIDLTGFRLFELAPPSVGDRVIFGARLASFKYDNEKGGWLIRFEPKSGVIITHTKALEAIGWRSSTDGDPPREGQP